MKKKVILICGCLSILLTSCGSFMDGLASMYGGGYGGVYNPYANFWGNESADVSVPAALDPNAAADAAAKQVMSNVVNGFWERAATGEQQLQDQINASVKDMWDHPERYYQNVPVQSGGVGGNSKENNGSSSSSSSSRTSTTSQQSKWRDCSLCHGKGTIVRDSYSSTYGQSDPMVYCAECGRSWHQSTGHRHVPCPTCHGNRGFWSE